MSGSEHNADSEPGETPPDWLRTATAAVAPGAELDLPSWVTSSITPALLDELGVMGPADEHS